MIKFENVSFRYDSKWILEEVNLEIAEKEFVCVVGPNGGGKSTLLKLMLGLIKPQQGRIELIGENASGRLGLSSSCKSLVGYMPQQLNYDLQFPMTVMDVVLMGLVGRHWFGLHTKKDKNDALSALEEVSLTEQRHRSFASLSGGQRQRVLIARALVSRPKILIMDEPMANIDREAQERLLETLSRLNKRLTIIMVSHDYRFVADAVTQVVCVNKHVALHPTTSVNDELLKRVFKGQVKFIQHDTCLEEGGCCNKEGHTHG